MTRLTPSAARARGAHGLARRIEEARATLCRGLRGIEPKLGRYDFDGACVQIRHPLDPSDWRTGLIRPLTPGQKSFSLGIFAYAQRADGGLKRGKAVRRITGYFGTGDRAPERAFEEAERVCAELEARS